MGKLWSNGWTKLYHSKYKAQRSMPDWRAYIEHELLSTDAQIFSCSGLSWLNSFLRSRCVLVIIVLLQVIPLFSLVYSSNSFDPELDWKCVTEQHQGLSSICELYLNKPYKRSDMCSMQLDIDFTWNNSHTNIPVVDFNAYCPLERGLEPKLINFLGAFCGSLIGGIFIDTLGRKNVALIAYFFSLVALLTYHVSSNMIMYTYQEFIKGFFGSIATTALLTWVVELAPAVHSTHTVAGYFMLSGIGNLLATGVMFITQRWRISVIILSAVGFGLIPLLFFVPPSARWCIAKGKLKLVPKNVKRRVDFTEGFIYKARAKDCLMSSQTNRIYATNTVLLLLVGYAVLALEAIVFQELEMMTRFQQLGIHNLILLLGFIVAFGLSFLQVWNIMYILHVFMLLLAGILCIVATSGDWAYDKWSIQRIFTGSALLLVSAAFSLTMTTIKQVPTLNRGFYTSGLLASFQLGGLLNIILKSRCLESAHEDGTFCTTTRDRDVQLLIVGAILLFSVALAFLNTCLSRPISLPHSYEELMLSAQNEGKEEVDVEEELEKSV